MKIKLDKIIQPAITIAIFAIGALLLMSSISFLSKQINDIFAIDEAKVQANTVKLDLETYRIAAERLDIKDSERSSPPPAETPSAEPGVQSSPENP